MFVEYSCESYIHIIRRPDLRLLTELMRVVAAESGWEASTSVSMAVAREELLLLDCLANKENALIKQ
jgi:hypothetical protein